NALCNPQPFDAFTQIKKYQYFAFRGNQVFRINQIGVLNGYPTNIEDVFPYAPHDINAALTLKINGETATYLIKDNKYWKYKSFGLIEANLTHTLWPDIPYNINAAFYIPKHGKFQATIYFIEGCKVHMYTVLTNKQFMKFNKVNLCHQLPSVDVENITAAAVNHRRLYIFIGNIYYRLRVRHRSNFNHSRNYPDYPRNKDNYWLGCVDYN
uniref:Uncharacterized protein n=1 Tax=Ciona intestinalis TaxID=7719 RepID=F6PIT9_CIOIN